MEEELNVNDSVSKFIFFNIRNKKRLILSIIIGVVSVILFQNLKFQYFKSTAICKSGISTYESLLGGDKFSQRTAVDLINLLEVNIFNKDYEIISVLLDIPIEVAKKIKFIKAEQLYEQDMNEKFYSLNKFEITLTVYDNSIVNDVQNGLIHFFESNKFIDKYQKIFIISNNNLIKKIEKEINELSEFRMVALKNRVDFSSFNFSSDKSSKYSDNQIISLYQRIEELNASILIEKPLSFVQNFSQTNKKENSLLGWSMLAAFVFYLFGLFMSFIYELE